MIQGYRTLFLPALCAALIGCSDTGREEATGKGNIRAINAVVGAPDVDFLIEERALGNVAYKSSMAVQQYDDLGYDFRFQVSLPGSSDPVVLDRQFLDVERDRDYVFVLDGTVDDPDMFLWDDALRQWDESETVFEMRFAHLSDTLGEIDVYFQAPDTDPVAGNQVATLANGERSDVMEFPEGEYRLTLTPAGDPQTILYRSADREIAAASTDVMIAFDPDPSLTGDVNVRHVSGAGASSELTDPRFRAQARFIHAAFGTGNVDVAEAGEFSPPLVADLAFGESTADVDLAGGETEYTFTAAGNMGATLLEETLTNTTGLHYTRILAGPPDDLAVINQTASRRPFATNPRLGIIHAASNFEELDVYLLPAGEPITDNNPGSSDVPFGTASSLSSLQSDNYELTLTLPDEDTIVGGPVALDLAAGDVVQALFLDTADPNVAEIVLLTP